MIRSIIRQILINIRALNFADEVAGVVTPATRDILNEGNVVARKLFPIYENIPRGCSSGDYICCIPDEKYTSLIYFEEVGNTITTQTNEEYKISSDVRLIGWFNLKKIGASITSDVLMRLIVQAIPDTVAEFDEIYNIRLSLTRIENKSPLIFSSYTYDEAENQYLIFPYDYGAVTYTVTYCMNKCLDDIVLEPNCGKRV